MDNNFNAQSLWNFDDSAMKTLKFFVDSCLDAFSNWDLNGINNSLRSIKRFASWGIGEKKWEEIESSFKELENLKRKVDNPKSSEEIQKDKIELYNKAEEIFIKIGRAMHDEGWVFRKGHDPRFAALRR